MRLFSNGSRCLLRLYFFAFAALLLCSQFAHAWNRGGHLVTGALAYEELEKSSPKALAELIAILPSHPAFSKWQSDLGDSPTVDRTKALLMLAAAFADDARIGQWKRFDKPNWHYVNFKYTPGQPLVDVLKTEPFNGKLLQALSANLTTYGDTSASLADRALAVSWVLHLAGDITQPLHVTALVNEDFPDGDRGGNSVYVRGSERAKRPVKLHKIWDDGATGIGAKLNQASHLATRLRKDSLPVAITSKNPAELIRAEAAMSYRIAVEQVYLNGALKYGTNEESDAPILPLGYTKRLKDLSDQQMLRAGILIAALLR